MCRVFSQIVLLAATLLSPLVPVLADTDETDYQLSESGYIQHIQAKDVASLLSELGSTYRECQDYRRELSAAVEDMQIDAGDIVITVILPGGLLYLGQKKVRLMAMESDLDSIDTVLVDLETDVARLSGGRQLAKTELQD